MRWAFSEIFLTLERRIRNFFLPLARGFFRNFFVPLEFFFATFPAHRRGVSNFFPPLKGRFRNFLPPLDVYEVAFYSCLRIYFSRLRIYTIIRESARSPTSDDPLDSVSRSQEGHTVQNAPCDPFKRGSRIGHTVQNAPCDPLDSVSRSQEGRH